MSGGGASLGELALRLAGSLALVVGLLLLIARTVNRRFKAPTGAAIQVVHRQALGRGQGVAVVSVGTRVLVLGTTEQQVTLLAEVEPDEIGLDLDAVDDERVPFEAPGAHRGPLAGSVLSPQTWKQTLAAVTGQADAVPPRRRAS
jgi:flagellar protein FliO/FliZ